MTSTPLSELATVQTFLRPDFHEWFPVFSREAMHERLATMPFELATLLKPRNVRLAMQIDSGWRYLRYLRQPVAVKRILLSEVLVSRGMAIMKRHQLARRRKAIGLSQEQLNMLAMAGAPKPRTGNGRTLSREHCGAR